MSSEMLVQPTLSPYYGDYVEILEKTNQQLSLWFNPYALMVAVISVLFAILAIGATYILYKQSRDYRERLDEEIKQNRTKLENQQNTLLADLESKHANMIKLYNEQFRAIKDKPLETLSVKKIPAATVIRSKTLGFKYWYATNEMRYTFPTEDIFHSWFPPHLFSPVIFNLPDEQLAAIVLGGNITYKPGSRIVKQEGSDDIYAVARRGVIRKIANNTVAVSIFGPNWGSILITIPNALFADYTIGQPIETAQDFNPQLEGFSVKLP